MLGNLVSQRGGDDGLAHDRVLRHGALLDTACTDVVQQQNADLVAGEQLIAAILALDGDAHAVCVRVGSQHQISTGLLGQLQTQAQSLKNFRVGVRAGREVAVGILLLGHDGDIGDADVAQDMGDGHKARAVQRAIDQLETGSLADTRADGAGLNGGIEGVDAVVADILDHPLGQTILKGNELGPSQDIRLLDLGVDDVGGLIGHLAAVRAVGLVAVVLGNGLAAALGLDPVGKALGGLADNVNIHAVGACADDAAQTGGAEFQGYGKAVLDGGIVALDAFQLRFQVGVIQLCGEPALIHILIHK